MPSPSVHATRALLGSPGVDTSADVVIALLDLAHETRIATAEEDWGRLDLVGLTATGTARQALPRLAADVARNAERADHVLAVADELTRVLVEAVKNDPSLVQLIRDQAASHGLTLDAGVVELLDVMDANPADADLRSLAPDPASATSVRSLVVGGSAVATAASRGLMGQVQAAVQRAFAGWSRVRDDLPGAEEVREAIAPHAEALAARLSAAQHQGHSAVVGATVDRAALLAMVDAAESIALDAAPAQALAHLVAEDARAAGRGGAAEELGRQALHLGRTMREAIATQAAGYALLLHLTGVHPDDTVADVILTAPSLPLTRGLPDGPDTPIADMPAVPAGTLVEVFGVADAMSTIVESGGKLVGRLTLLDPSSDARVRADLVFTNPQHVGVTLGAFCSVTGTVAQPGADGQPRILADKVAVTAEATRSWRGALLHVASPYLPYWRARTNLSWTAGPHAITRTPTDVDEAASDMGAAELIFLPFRAR